jgi:hypothetical protein
MARDVWQGVAMDFLKFFQDPPCPTLLRPAAVFYPFGHPTLRTFSIDTFRSTVDQQFRLLSEVWLFDLKEGKWEKRDDIPAEFEKGLR